MRHDGRVVGVGRRSDELQRPAGSRLEIEERDKPVVALLQHEESRMGIRKVEFATGCEYGCNDVRPDLHVRQPADCPPSRKDQVERPRRQMRGLVHAPLDEVGFQPGLDGKLSRHFERCAGEVESDRHGAASDEAERVSPNVALQVEDALSGDVAEFGRFYGVKGILARTKTVEHVRASGVTRMNRRALFPVPKIDFNRIDYAELPVRALDVDPSALSPAPNSEIRLLGGRELGVRSRVPLGIFRADEFHPFVQGPPKCHRRRPGHRESAFILDSDLGTRSWARILAALAE